MAGTDGFIDSASIHGAIAALSLRGSNDLGAWERQSLLEATYLLLFTNIGIVPGPGGYRGASGLFEHVVAQLPSLERRKLRTDSALRATKAWLTKNPSALREAWDRLRAEPELPAWSAVSRELFWLHHVRMHISLFNPEFIPHIAPLLGIDSDELRRINRMSQDENVVQRWVKTNLAGDDAKIADSAYVTSALIRGRLHEYIASGSKVHLAGHPLRTSIQRPLRRAEGGPVLSSEEYFVKAIIGSALLETTQDRRVKTWVDNVVKARRAIESRQAALPETTIDSYAERCAADAARACGISASYSRVRRELDVATALGMGAILTIGVSPWIGPLGPIAAAFYAYHRRASIGDDIARKLMDTTKRFRRLARSVPGRIVRNLKPPE